MKFNHSIRQTLRYLKGNQRACVVTEPLWSIPNNLILPFVSIYMAEVGLNDVQIGTVASFGLAMQFIWGLFSGAIIDKYGRRRMMLVFGLLSWTIPCILWADAHGYLYFMLAVFFNSMWRVTGNSFSCMIIEDGDPDQLINIYTILNLFGLVAGFISPIVGFFIDRFTLVPTMRILYILSMVMMTTKFILQYRMSNESDIGNQRIEECKGHHLFSLTFGNWNAFASAIRQSRILLYVMLMILMTCFNTVEATFWPLFITAAYGISNSMLSLFPLVKAIITISVYLFITSHLSLRSIQRPLLTGLGSHMLGLIVLLVCQPMGVYALWAVFFSAICEAFALAILGPLCESLMSISIPSEERARTNSLIFAAILFTSTPAGWIAGQLSQISRALPLALNLCIVIAEMMIVLCIARIFQKE